jgi:hypothetical protein
MADFVNYRGVSHQVVYVDPTLGSGLNDGTTTADAFQQLPHTVSLSGNALYLLRRSNTPVIAQKGNCPNSHVLVVGMPATSGQMFFTDLPATVRNTWGLDSEPSVTVFVSGAAANTPWRFGLSDSNAGYGLFNLFIHTSPTINQKYGMVHIYGPNVTVDSCTFTISGTPISGNASSSLTEWTGLHISNGDGCSINNIDTISYGYGDSYSDPNSYQMPSALFVENYYSGGMSNACISNSTFRCITNPSVNSRTYGLNIRGWSYASVFKNLKFYTNLSYTGNSNSYTLMRLGSISNACVVDGISGWCGFNHKNPAQNQTGYGIYVDYGVNATSESYMHRKVSKHTFKNIYFDDQSDYYGCFCGIRLGDYWQDCTFDNIKLYSPNASNLLGTPIFSIGAYTNHLTFDNIDLDAGSNLSQPIPNNNNIHGLYIGGDINQQRSAKSYLKNSRIKSSKLGIYSLGSLDISNTSVTGGVYVYGDAVELNTLAAPLSSGRFSSAPNLLYHIGGSGDERWATNSVIKINELVNRSIIGHSINFGSALVAVECMSAAGVLNSIGGPTYDTTVPNAGAIYVNNFPQDGYWLGQNAWHRFSTSVVQFTTANSVNSGFSLEYMQITSSNFTGAVEQAFEISPPPYKGNEVSTTTLAAQRQYKAVLYFATKYATAVTSSELWFEIEIPSGVSGTDTRIMTTRGMLDGVQVDNTGTVWLGESPLSIYRIVLPFILDRQESIYTRIFWNKTFGPPGKAFIAPRIIIEE